jgi:hypothetical protein
VTRDGVNGGITTVDGGLTSGDGNEVLGGVGVLSIGSLGGDGTSGDSSGKSIPPILGGVTGDGTVIVVDGGLVTSGLTVDSGTPVFILGIPFGISGIPTDAKLGTLGLGNDGEITTS